MKTEIFIFKKIYLILILLFIPFIMKAQSLDNENNFWRNVRFGGGLGLSAVNGFFSASLAPAAIYDFNQYFSAGVGLQGSYASGNNYKATTYGGSLLGFLRPLSMLRLSAELELLQVNFERELSTGTSNRNYLYPALFLGAGYQSGAVTVGLRYDVLYNEDRSIHGSPVMPFVTVFF